MTKKFYTLDGDEYKEAEAFTQEDVDNIIAKRLERATSKYSDYEELKQRAESADTLKSEYEEKLANLDTEKSDLESKLTKANLEVDKVKIINEFKLSDDLAEFLDGNSTDEIRLRAEKLAKGITGGVKVDKQEKPQGESTDTAKIAKNLFGKSSD